MLVKSSPTGWVNGTLFAWWFDQFRLGIEQQRIPDPSWRG
jgi:hypothetical protein